MRERYTPVDQANTDHVRFFISFPSYVDRERIGVNMPRLERLCKAGRISALAVVGRDDGDTSSSTPEVVGVTSKGEAFAGKAAVKKEPLFGGRITHFSPEPNLPTYMFTFAQIDINLNEAVDRAIKDSKGEKGVRDADTWTKYMDTALKEGVTRAGLHNLTAHGRGRFLYNVGFAAAWSGIVSGLGLFGGRNFAELFAISSLLYNQMDNIGEFFRGKRYGLDGYQWSLFYGVQLDRALIFLAQSRRGNLIKALK